MSWDDIYRKWGISEAGIAGLNVVTWLALAVAAVIAGLLILGAVGEWIKSLKKTDEKEKKPHRKEMWTKLGFAFLCLFAGFLWPAILWIMDAFGVGKITSGDFIPNAFNLIKEIGVINI